ncbi:MAG: energy transducer TonB [Pyrinomonadaceae bacterium]
MKYRLLAQALFVPVLGMLSHQVFAQTGTVAKVASDSPAVIAAVAPYYPSEARTKHAIGSVKVDVVIDPRGNVVSAKVSSGHPALRWACESDAKKWQFAPAEPSAANRTVQLTFQFTFDPDDRNITDEDRQHELVTFKSPYYVEIGIYPVLVHTRET